MFEWIVDTKAGEIMTKWSKVFQPAHDDIEGWKIYGDVGKFKPATMEKFQDAWDTLPASSKKKIYKLFLKLKKLIPASVLIALIKAYFKELQAWLNLSE